jgi:hypothetical protein
MYIRLFLIRILLLTTLIFITACSFSQGKTEPFDIDVPVGAVPGSFYNSIVFIDTRIDSTHMGYVKVGAFDTKASVIMEVPFADQVTRLLRSLTDQNANNNTIYLCVRNLFFTELTQSVVNKGTFHFRASLYSFSNNSYYKISELDTFLMVKSMDATNGLLKGASNVIVSFIRNNLIKNPSDAIGYTYNEIKNPDSTEKSKLKLYTTTAYTEGLYSSYQSFSNQLPDKQVVVEEKKSKIKIVRIIDGSGNQQEVKQNLLYALVYKGTPYISTSFGYYPLVKRNDNFYFTGRAKNEADMGMAMMFGVAGALLSESGTSVYEMKLDHHSGRFIQIRELQSGTK